jgi:hypothetical protein
MEAILDYRNAKYAVVLFNQGSKGATELRKYPHLLQILLEMKRAQSPGEYQTVTDVMRGQPEVKDEERR